MKEFKSIGFNLDAMTPLLIPLFVFLYVPDMLDVFFNNYIYIIGGVLFYALFCITVVKVNREGIRKELYLAPITLKRRTWREIKHYAHVTENWSGSNGKTKYEMLWFIDYNDKVCLRIQKSTRKNLDKILENRFFLLILRTIVKGPGQKLVASLLARSVKITYFFTSSMEEKCAISGLFCGLFFAS